MTRRDFPARLSLVPHQSDDELTRVERWWLNQDSARDRIRWVLRDSLDELLDGRRTGRWCYQQLKKTERTHLGTTVEINLTREFDLADGDTLDWKIDGIEIDCKFSKDFGGWEIPMEMYRCADHGDRSSRDDHLALLVWMNDDRSSWAAGLVRVTDALLAWRVNGGRAYNRDNKRKLSTEGLNRIMWLWDGRPNRDLPSNVLLHMGHSARDRVFSASRRSGQARVNQLFREMQGQLVNRATVETVAQQDDSMKRARDARLPSQLGREGIVVLGHQEAHPVIARMLELPVPSKGEFVSCRVARAAERDPRSRVWIDGAWWALADDRDAVVPAPRLPERNPPQGWTAYLAARETSTNRRGTSPRSRGGGRAGPDRSFPGGRPK